MIVVEDLDAVELAALEQFRVLNNCSTLSEAATLLLERMLRDAVSALPVGEEKKDVRH
jgi:hypothetical protein